MDNPKATQNVITGIAAIRLPVAVKFKRPEQMAVLEPPHHGAVGGRQTQQIQHERLQWDHHAAEEQEQKDEHDQGDEAEGQGHARFDDRGRVEELGRDRPPTRTGWGDGVARTVRTTDSDCTESGSTVGSTANQVPPGSEGTDRNRKRDGRRVGPDEEAHG